MRKYSRYEKYKPSNVDWLGEIPEHWETQKIKYMFSSCNGGTPDTSNPDYWDGTIPWVSAKDMKTNKLYDTEDHITELGLKESSTKYIAPGQVLLVVRSGILKHTIPVAVNIVPVAINQDIKALRPINNLLSEFLCYFIIGCQTSLLAIWSKQSCTVESIEDKYFTETYVPFISCEEQKKIIDFLDRETAKIDSLIQKRNDLIKLLQEKRSAVISHAVTKGIDPTVRLKPSNIDWLGEIPEHWEVKPLKYEISINDNVLSESTNPLMEFDYIDIGGVSFDLGIVSKQHYVFEDAPSRARRKVKAGNVIVSTVRTYLRAIAFISPEDERCIVSTGFAVLCPKKIHSKYLSFFCLTAFFIENVVSRSTGVSYPAINAGEIGNISVVIPPLSEQQKIADFLDRETAKIDSLIKKEKKIIKKMKEYRTALISAAVTGKIDVRGEEK